jgi:dUTP pyrophosphatase
MKIKVENKLNHNLPEYSPASSTCTEIRGDKEHEFVSKPPEKRYINTGVSLEVPVAFGVHIRQKSGLALNKCVTMLNSQGITDTDFSEENSIISLEVSEKKYGIIDY